VNARSVLTEILAGLRKVLGHDREDLHTCIAILLDSFECDVEWETCNLKIKLEACDTFWCTSNLEVHVAEVIFCAEDVSEEYALGDLTILVLFSHEASGDTSTGCCNWHTCIHEREATATNRCH
jgi:hypothetical protein